MNPQPRKATCSGSPMPLLAPARQLVAALRIGRRDVDVEGAKRRAPGIADLVAIAALDQHDRSGAQRHAPPVDRRRAAARSHEQPLIRAPMTVVGPSLAVAG